MCIRDSDDTDEVVNLLQIHTADPLPLLTEEGVVWQNNGVPNGHATGVYVSKRKKWCINARAEVKAPLEQILPCKTKGKKPKHTEISEISDFLNSLLNKKLKECLYGLFEIGKNRKKKNYSSAIACAKNAVSYTHLTLPTIYSV